jgi:hypothetical protein
MVGNRVDVLLACLRELEFQHLGDRAVECAALAN